MTTRWLLLWAVSLCALSLPAGAADWPQWRGPDRNDISRETGLLKTWPAAGPPLLWTNTNAGIGYAGPAVVGDRLFTLGERDDQFLVLALDVKTGQEVWATPMGPRFQNNYGGGPRSTPTVDGTLLYALGASGDLVCLETATGRTVWHKNLKKDFGGQMMSGWGYSESPLVDGDKLVCTPGGSEGTVAALNKKTGEVLWRSKDLTDRATYASLVVAELGGVRQYIRTTHKNQTEGGVAGIAADDGRLLWFFPKHNYRVAVIPTPVVHDNYVYVTAGYGAGCDLLQLIPDGRGTKVEEVYSNREMDNKHGGVVLLDGYLYGWTDHGNQWICQNFKTGKVVWESKKLRRGSLTYADGHLYCYSEDNGTAVLVKASPTGWEEDGRFSIPQTTSLRSPSGGVWTHPVVANGRLYLRDQELLFCFDIKQR
jgi:outer membrane protein assembly factor BamB